MSTDREAAFSNGTDYHCWRANWCDRCRNDINEDCPIVATALFCQGIPAEWLPQANGYPADAYHCVMFKGFNEPPNPEPQPQPDPPDMDGLFDCPERRVRMYVQPQLSEVTA